MGMKKVWICRATMEKSIRCCSAPNRLTSCTGNRWIIAKKSTRIAVETIIASYKARLTRSNLRAPMLKPSIGCTAMETPTAGNTANMAIFTTTPTLANAPSVPSASMEPRYASVELAMTCVMAMAACRANGAMPMVTMRLQSFQSGARFLARSLNGAFLSKMKYQSTHTDDTTWPSTVALAEPATPHPKTSTNR